MRTSNSAWKQKSGCKGNTTVRKKLLIRRSQTYVVISKIVCRKSLMSIKRHWPLKNVKLKNKSKVNGLKRNKSLRRKSNRWTKTIMIKMLLLNRFKKLRAKLMNVICRSKIFKSKRLVKYKQSMIWLTKKRNAKENWDNCHHQLLSIKIVKSRVLRQN